MSKKRDLIFKKLFDKFDVDYDKLSLLEFSYALRYLFKYARINEDGEYVSNFFISKENKILNHWKGKERYRSIIISELENKKMIKKIHGNMFGENNIHKCEQFRINKSVYAEFDSLTTKQKGLILGIDENFNIIDDDIMAEIIEKARLLSEKTRADMELELVETLKQTKIVIPKELKQSFFNFVDAPKIAWYNHDAPSTSISAKCGRIFHPMTQLDKRYRKFMTMMVNGRRFPLKCIDLKSSQPLLLTTIIEDEAYENIVKNSDIYDFLVEKAHETVYTFKKGKKVRNRTFEECMDVEERMFNMTYCDCKYKRPDTRDGMKIQFMRFVGSNRRLMIIDQILEQHLPEFYAKCVAKKKELDNANFIVDENGEYVREERTVKMRNGKGYVKNVKVYKSKNEKVYLTTILQQIESDIFISVWEKYSDMSIPLHDSIYFPYDESGRKIKNMEKPIMKALIAKFEEYGIDGYDLVGKIERYS